ncbi:RND family transporter [Mycobacterium crocinum]|uniref:RND family transporter n=1 Tax=Mycolicibacterium crocinum TaxID=388459 RepID=A0ABY3TTJ3_9MYCO|nr:RND family transporter [Mycolicibacterium crocinum]MCV7217265.1 RND family transporter [Mycolicibacterium crocinum]ULN42994.1 RND family transporter [Mycolicibacterium crocinum]
MSKRAVFRGVSPHKLLTGLGRVIVRHPLLVIAAWLVLAGALLALITPLSVVAARNPPSFLPQDAPVLQSVKKMQGAFHEADAGNFAAIILSNENGLTPADEDAYRRIVDKLKDDTKNVTSLQDFVRTPELKEVMTSKDGKAWNLPVSMSGTMGSPDGQEAYRNVINTVQDAAKGSSLQVNVVGGASTLEDMNAIGARDQHMIEIATVGLVFTILLLVYRSLIAMLMPLITIGISLVVAQQAVAGLGELGLGLGPQTMMLMTGMIMGAGIDYGVFLYSRYQELTKTGMASDNALVEALASIGEVIAGSAGTVALTFLGMSFTKLAIFSTVGPALTVTIVVGFLASITLLPAFIVLAGRRGWIKQRKDITGRLWRRSGVMIVRRPVLLLVTSVLILGALAATTTMMKFNYDDRKNLPQDSASNHAYEVMDRHFPISGTLQQFLFIQSPNDLRSPKALADMEQMAARIAQLPDIDMVRGITRPTGQVLEQAKTTYQAGEVGTKLGDASNLIHTNDDNLSLLSGGAGKMADVLGEIRTQVVGSIASVRGLASALDTMSQKYGGTKTLDQIDKTASLVTSMRSLGDALGLTILRVTGIGDWASPMLNALNVSPECDADPACVNSRSDLQKIVDVANTPAVKSIEEFARELSKTDGSQKLDDSVHQLSQNVQKVTAAARSLGVGQPGGVEKKLNDAVTGVNTLADSSRQLAVGVQTLVDQTRNLGQGLDQASSFLLAMKREAADPPMSGFYIPPQVLTMDEFKKAAKLFVSEDGHSARYLVQTALNPFSTEAMDQTKLIVSTANAATPNTQLAGSEISMVGFSSINANVRDFYDDDFVYILSMTLVVVFLILVVLLRALVAPLYLVLSVVLSYGAALGIGVVLFQFILGQELAWGVPGIAFMVLVAVGADYNLLLISRIRDEAKYGVRSAVIRTVGATGGVITSAGLIFAASMMALTVSSVLTAAQIGFVIGVGLLLDTFLVRTLTVPAAAVLVGNANWWPAKPPSVKYKAAKAAEAAAASAAAAAAATAPVAVLEHEAQDIEEAEEDTHGEAAWEGEGGATRDD